MHKLSVVLMILPVALGVYVGHHQFLEANHNFHDSQDGYLQDYGHHEIEEQLPEELTHPHTIHEEIKAKHGKDYNFDYTVHDPHTQDYKSHRESRQDGVVKGYYAVKDADGSLREVHYTADKKEGFKAIVPRNGEQVHPHVPASTAHADLHSGHINHY